MTRVALGVIATAISIVACGPAPRPRWACEAAPRLYPSVNGPIPVCPWMIEGRDCAALEDYDHDGRSDVHDLEAFCRVERDGDSLTMDTQRPGDTSSWCWTCD